MSRSKKLYKLQKIDSAIDQAKKRISDIDTILEDDEELIQAQEQEAIARRKLEEKRKILKRAEREVKDQERKIEQNNAKLYGGKVTNPKELEDLQLESESLERYLAVLEERQLEAMLEVDQAQAAHKQALQELQEIQKKRKLLHNELNQERTDLEKEIQTLSEQRKAALEDISEKDLDDYENLRQSLGGIAVAKVNNNSCSACGTQVPSAVYQKARSASQLTHCKTCNRILHAD
ncbi:MAG: C4-type zinc ribbon domain-containing protein [Anaerolineales bacterium]